MGKAGPSQFNQGSDTQDREAMDLFKATFEQAAVGMAHLDREGRYLRVNRSLCDFLGYSAEELLARTWFDVTHPEDQQANAHFRARLKAGEVASGQLDKRYMRKDGSIAWGRLTLTVVNGPAGQYLYTLAVVQDISERQRAEQDLAEAVGRLDFHLDNAPVAFIEWDEHFRVSRWSRGAERIFGWRAVEVLGRNWHDWKFVHEEDRDRVDAHVQSLLERRGARQSIRNRNYRKDGSVIHCLWHNSLLRTAQGSAVSLLSMCQDFTERERAAQALRERESLLKLFIEHAPAAIAMFDTHMRYLVVSRHFVETYGLQGRELLGRSHYDVFPEIPERWREVHRRCLAGAVERAENDPFVRADGRTQWNRWEIRPWYSASGTVGGIILFTEDVTASVQAREDLRRAKEEAEAASRAKSDFLANMSHEIRTPMNGVLGMTELALLTCTEPRTREYLEMARQSGKALLFLINDVLDLSKIEAGRIELEERPFDLREELESLFQTMGLSAREKGLRLTHEVHPKVPRGVIGDPGRLRQVLVNLVGNAIKYTLRGTVGVLVGPASEAASRPGSVRLLFRVVDTGIGIPADKQAAIFESFTQLRGSAHPDFGGTGLGLTISRELVHLMGGEISVESEPGRGSTFSFTIELGLAPREALPARQAEEVASGQPSRLNILLAEDNAINRVLAVDLLESRGHTVKAVGTGREAVEALAREPVDLVLMDVRMPEMDGLEATRHIRAGVAGNPHVPIVALTAYALADDRERLLAAGMDDYLPKPIEMEELDRVLARFSAAQGGRRSH